jgi:hypothetical protein
MKSTIYSTLVVNFTTIIVVSIFFIVVPGLSTTPFVNVNVQGEGANQTIQQQEDPQHSANRTMEKAIQSANETGEDVGKFGSQVTEGAKDVIGSIGEKLQDLGK